eukprot:GHVS01097909.1.p1 GENE.GHVS01097909.1~~GHVS01097909.1.p1  ORF type:complete len:461 (-),score=59.03 GHVS01097909.1:136-1518(-)
MTMELVESTTAEEEAGGRMAERSQRTGENISRRRRATPPRPPWRLFAAMGLRALGCLLNCWGHESLRQTLVPPLAVSVAEPASLFYPPAHTLAEAAAPGQSMIPAIQPDMTPVGEKERMLKMKISEKHSVPVYVFVADLVDAVRDITSHCNCDRSSYNIRFFKESDTMKQRLSTDLRQLEEGSRFIFVTDERDKVGNAIKLVVEHGCKDCVFGYIRVTKKDAGVDTVKEWPIPFKEMVTPGEHPNLVVKYWCKYLAERVAIGRPFLMSIDFDDENGCGAFSKDMLRLSNPAGEGFLKKKDDQTRAVFMSLSSLGLSQGDAVAEMEIRKGIEGLEIKREVVERSIKGFKDDEDAEYMTERPVLRFILSSNGQEDGMFVEVNNEAKFFVRYANGDSSQQTETSQDQVSVKRFVIDFQKSPLWSQDHGDVVVINVDEKKLILLNPLRLQIGYTQTIGLFTHGN